MKKGEVKHHIIDASNKDPITVQINNTSSMPLLIKRDEYIAHILYKKAVIPNIKTKVTISNTTNTRKRYRNHTNRQGTQPYFSDKVYLNIILFNSDELNESIDESEDIDNAQIKYIHTNIEPPYQIYMFTYPIEDTTDIEIRTRDDNEALGLIIKNKIPRRRSTQRN